MGDYNPEMGDAADDLSNLGDEATLRARVAEAIFVGGGVSTVSTRTGIPVGTLSKYTAKTSTASFTNAAKIAAAAGVTLDQIAFSQEEISQGAAQAKIRQIVSDISRRADRISNLDQPNFVRLPVYAEVQASAGPGAVPASEQANNVVAFERGFLRDQGGNPDRCSIIFARGTSMKPTIPDGAILVVDHSQRDVAHGCIYVFNVCDQLLVKRARWRMDGKLELVSDNKNEDYPVETFGPEQVDDLRVVGRVVYFCRAP